MLGVLQIEASESIGEIRLEKDIGGTEVISKVDEGCRTHREDMLSLNGI